MTTDPAVDAAPQWTPDGTRLLFMSSRQNDEFKLYSQNADGTGTAEPFLPDAARVQADTWANDGKTLLVTVGRGGRTNVDIGAVDVEGDRNVQDVIATPAIEAAAALSPNGGWLAYHSDLSGTREVYVERFPGLGDRQKISTNGGASPRWSRDGRSLFYQSPDGRSVWSVSMSQGPMLVAGTPQRLFEGRYVPIGPTMRPFDVAPDGQFLLIRNAPVGQSDGPVTIVVVQNWFEERKRLVSVN